MENLTRSAWCLFFLTLFCQIVATDVFAWGSQPKSKKEIESYIQNQVVPIIPTMNKIHTGYGIASFGEFYYVKSIDKLFFQDDKVNATVRKIKFDDEKIFLTFYHEKYGQAEISYVIPEKIYEEFSLDNFKELLSLSLTSADILKVFVNSETSTIHLFSSNHIPPGTPKSLLPIDEAKSNGNSLCSICFKHYIYLPDYDEEEMLAKKIAANVRYMTPIARDEKGQKALQTLGQKVLDNWPIDLLGYDYKFLLNQSDDINASALPGGEIFVTTALYDSVEYQGELEAVLAHEIAHVERRHALKKHKAIAAAVQGAQAMAGISSAIAGASYSQGKYDQAAISASMSIGMVSLVVNSTYGYSKDLEREADALALLYFKKNNLNLKDLENIFRKMQFMKLSRTNDPDPENKTHPQLSERFAFFNYDNVRLLDPQLLYSTKERSKYSYVKPLFFENIEGKTFLNIFCDNKSLNNMIMGKGANAFDERWFSLKLKTAEGNFSLRYRNDYMTEGQFGTFLKFYIKDKPGILRISEIEEIEIEARVKNSVDRDYFKFSQKKPSTPE